MKLIIFTLLFSVVARAEEPLWCDVDTFEAKYEATRVGLKDIKRLREFQIGKLKLVGLAVGGSSANEVLKLSPAPADKKFCTWYLNEGNKHAEEIFHHKYLPGPYMAILEIFRTTKGIARDYEERLTPFAGAMIDCAESYGYVAAGCDGQFHRGPSEFAWFLGLSGCTAQSALDIANKVFGTNHVPKRTRKAIAQKGVDLGDREPMLRKRLQKVMTR